MKPVNQTIITKNRGDCMRAVIASLFELEIIQVPHFLLFSKDEWYNVYCAFVWSLGYEVHGTRYVKSKLHKQETVNGGISAFVPSKNLGKGICHNVIVNQAGLVIHDPHPKKDYQGVNVLETKELKSWDIIEAMPKGN